MIGPCHGGVVVDKDGNIYTSAHAGVFVFSPEGKVVRSFLGDKLLPATSNSVERGNRRYRKMQKTIYRVRTKQTLQGRLALDLQRDQHASGRDATLTTFHKNRS